MKISKEIKDTIDEFLIEEFELEAELIKPEALLKEDLDIESLDFVDIAVIVEKEFGFKVVTEEMIDIRTLEDLYNYVQMKVDQK